MPNSRLNLDPDGLQRRRQVIGNAFVDASLAQADDFGGPLQEIITNHVWGDIWRRPGLDPATRSLVTLAVLTALNRSLELELHVAGAVRNGCSVEQIREVLIQCSAYCGMPAAVDAFAVARRALQTAEDVVRPPAAQPPAGA
ncbi:MAG: carboxymuconolactone decarboxylase family protein [Pseudonocardiaceae bacterium]